MYHNHLEFFAQKWEGGANPLVASFKGESKGGGVWLHCYIPKINTCLSLNTHWMCRTQFN